MNFSEWLQEQLNRRNWSQSDLRRQLEKAGYPISQGQLSRIVNDTREASPDICIGIAVAFGVGREEVFRIRGWLLSEPEQVFGPEIDPRILELAKEMNALPPKSKELALGAIEPMLFSVRQLTDKIQELSTNGHEHEN